MRINSLPSLPSVQAANFIKSFITKCLSLFLVVNKCPFIICLLPSMFYSLYVVLIVDNNFFKFTIVVLFTARCTIVHSAVLRLHVVCPSVCLSVRLSVRPSVCDVGGSGPHRLEISETNCTDN